MWFLQGDTLCGIALIVLAAVVLRQLQKVVPRLPVNVLIPVLEVLLLGYVGLKLAVFYVLYTAVGLGLCAILFRIQKGRRFLFVLFCLLSLVPFLLSRFPYQGIDAAFVVFTVGIAFQMLKMIDALFYVYYAELAVRPLAYVNYMLFILVFTSGPIFRYRDFIATYDNPTPLTWELAEDCTKRVILGFFKKLVLSQLAVKALALLSGMEPRWYLSVGTVVLSYLVLYFDLSGYSDIAIGFGRFCGYQVPENFKNPLDAATFTQFWRKWHATLSDWIREHVYVVVSKKKLGRLQSGLIAFMTMILMGLWHGFTVPYLISALYLAVLLMLENFLGLTTLNKRKANPVHYWLRCILTNFLFALNTLVFTLPADKVISTLLGFVRL